MRVHELAKEYKLTSYGLIELLQGIGVPVEHHLSWLDESQVQTAKDLLTRISKGQERLIFLCYSSKDLEFMHRLRKDLTAAEITVWTAENIKAGTPSWVRAIQEAIIRSRAVVVILSENAANSVWVESEILFAQNRKKTIIPVLVKDEPDDAIPMILVRYQWIDARSNYAAAVKKLIKDLP